MVRGVRLGFRVSRLSSSQIGFLVKFAKSIFAGALYWWPTTFQSPTLGRPQRSMAPRSPSPSRLSPPRKSPEMLGFYTPDSPYAKRENNTFRSDKSDDPFAEHPRSTVVSDVVTDHHRGRKFSITRAPQSHLRPISPQLIFALCPARSRPDVDAHGRLSPSARRQR